jgi:uncharacterized protein
MAEVKDNIGRSRFELEESGLLAFADYVRRDGRLLLPHVEAAPELRGTGAAGRLMEGVLAIARREGSKVVPICGYAKAYIRRHREHQDLLA